MKLLSLLKSWFIEYLTPSPREFDPEPHGSRDTFNPYPTKCDDQLIAEMQAAIDSIKEEDLKPFDRPVPPIPSPQDKTIHYHNKRWWFWDETNMHRHGPYETHAECVKDFNHYCNVYLDYDRNDQDY